MNILQKTARTGYNSKLLGILHSEKKNDSLIKSATFEFWWLFSVRKIFLVLTFI